MRVRMLTALAGPSGLASEGEEIDLPDADAVRLIKAGLAETVRDPAQVERATKRSAKERAA